MPNKKRDKPAKIGLEQEKNVKIPQACETRCHALNIQGSTFDLEAAKARVMAREAAKEKNNAKSESFSITTEKYALFCEEITQRKKKGWSVKSWEDDAALEQAVAEYKAFIFAVKLYPTIEGLSSWLDITTETYRAVLSINDKRSYVLKKYKSFLDDFSAQNIISTEGNPAGNMYLDKSRLGFSDQPSEMNINLNLNPVASFAPSDFGRMVEDMPAVDVEFEEVPHDDSESEK